jgi:hypothetical protein
MLAGRTIEDEGEAIDMFLLEFLLSRNWRWKSLSGNQLEIE